MNSRSVFWLLLVLGVTVRCVALREPLVDAHLLRQCQTAAVTQSLMEQPGLPVAARIPWLGDLDTRFILELPIYNYLTLGMHRVVGNLDASGKLTSILLWALSFWLLQGLWRRVLDADQTLWANLLFVCAPLEVFYGQAFMPEMLVQVLAFGFLLLVIRYGESPTAARWWLCASVGLLALVVKLPEIAHLYIILGVAIVTQLGWKAAFWPRHLLAAVLSAVCLKWWGGYVDAVNSVSLPEWSGGATLRGFIGPIAMRFQLKPWVTLAGYLGLFVVPGIAGLGAVAGGWNVLRHGAHRLLWWWLAAVVVFYLLWFGNAGTAQSYYNLPAVAPLCALFAIGITRLLTRFHSDRARTMVGVAIAVLLIASVVPGIQYSFRQDRVVLDAARWCGAHTQPGDVVIFQLGHRFDMIDYPYNPVVAYYAQRPTFIWTRTVPALVREKGLECAKFALVTNPPTVENPWAVKLRRFRGRDTLPAPDATWLADAGFVEVERNGAFTAYRRP